MTTLRKSKTEAELERRAGQVEAGSPRHRALVAARAFKGSWIRLGEALWEVQQQRDFAGWGFKTFTDYCRHELHIREETARKLTRSFAYLADHNPQQLQRAQQGEASPPLDVVDLLRQARGRTQVDPSAFADLEAEALGDESAPLSRARLLAKLREADPAAYPPPSSQTGLPAGAEAAGEHAAASTSDLVIEGTVNGFSDENDDAARPIDAHHARKVLLLAERLQALLGEQPALAKPFRRAALDELVGELRQSALSAPQGSHGAAGVVKLYPVSPID